MNYEIKFFEGSGSDMKIHTETASNFDAAHLRIKRFFMVHVAGIEKPKGVSGYHFKRALNLRISRADFMRILNDTGKFELFHGDFGVKVKKC